MSSIENTPQWSIEMQHTSRSDRTNIRRPIDTLKSPQLAVNGCRTLYECIREGANVNPLGPCFGFRAMSTSSGYATPFIFATYTECIARIDCFAAGLQQLSLVERNDDNLLLIGIYLKNCMEWVLAEHAIFTLGGATVPFYDTLGPTTVLYILQQTNVACIVCVRNDLDKLIEAKLSGSCEQFKYVILVDGVVTDSVTQAEKAGLSVISFAKVESIGSQVIASQKFKHNPPSSKDLATFCYTSGTTGNPKGAMLSHENIISGLAGTQGLFDTSSVDRYLSYLPLPHVMERVTMAAMLTVGASIGFYRGDPLLLMEDVQALRPTIFVAAPRVLNKIHDKIQAGISTAGGFKKKLFDAAMHSKSKLLREQGIMKHTIYDTLLFNKIKKALGLDAVRVMVSGSAPLSETVMNFYRVMLGVPVLEGYGQTEGTAIASISSTDDMTTCGHVGPPIHPVEMVLIDIPEMGYLHTDTSHRGEACLGRGEVCIRGPNVFMGYYKNPEATAETIDSEGWLHSGDVGMWTINGQLKIIDRKKNIFKLSQGEYVAPEKIENIIMQSGFISQAFVYGDSLQSCLVAIIVPDEDVVKSWATDKSISNSFPELCKGTALHHDLMSDILVISKKNGLHGFETVKAIYIDSEPFSVDAGLLTPTFKLKRQQLRDYYVKEIEFLYKEKVPQSAKSKL